MKKPIRVLFVSHDSSLYGAQRSLLGLLEKLDRGRFEPQVVAPYEGALTIAVKDLNIPVYICPIAHWVTSDAAITNSWIGRVKLLTKGLLSRTQGLAHLIEQDGIDLVYTNTVTCIEGALAAKMTNRPHVWHLREQVRGNSQLRTIFPPFLVPWIIHALSRRVIVNSNYLYKAYDSYPLRKKLCVVYNGVAPDKFSDDRNEASYALRTELNLSLNSKVITIIGSIIPRKGQLVLANAAPQIASSIPDTAFLIVGEGPSNYVQLVQNRIKDHELEMNFRFLGWRADIPKILAGTDLLVIAADEEPFGRTVIEAMAAGVPVVSTKCGGPEEIILDGITGLLVPPNNPSKMAHAIERILSNPEFSQSLVNASKKRFNQMFTLQVYADNMQSELELATEAYYRSAQNTHWPKQ